MNEPENITVGDAAQWARYCAKQAQDFQETVEAFRLGNLQATTERGYPPSRIAELQKTVDDMARARDEMISLANMWANVAGALHLVEGEKP
ncbi:hypothetical protein AB0D65_29590 [Streptomyces griseoloalbus]|uniref:Uncharacterized protein n=1 Tax=Streptomyces griseoloalbus TaxID=67303 RepID=A0ABV3ED24_9ACTN